MNDSLLNTFKAMVAAGIFIGVLSALPVLGMANCACCMWVIGGSILGAYLYKSFSGQGTGALRGLVIGLGAAILGSILFVALSSALTYAGLSSGQLIAAKLVQLIPSDQMEEQMRLREQRIKYLAPAQRERALKRLERERKQLEALRRGEIPRDLKLEDVMKQLIITSIAFSVAGALGGLIGGLLVPDHGTASGPEPSATSAPEDRAREILGDAGPKELPKPIPPPPDSEEGQKAATPSTPDEVTQGNPTMASNPNPEERE